MSKALIIKTPSPDDAASLSRLAIRSFRDTFTEGSNPDDMEAYVRDELSVERFRLELLDSDNTFLALFSPGNSEPIGYAKLRDAEKDSSVTVSKAIELQRLYVDKSAIGKGAGSQLMKAALDKAAALGFDGVWLGVWEHNERAIKFYERWQFNTVGSHLFVLGSDKQTDLIMERSLTGINVV